MDRKKIKKIKEKSLDELLFDFLKIKNYFTEDDMVSALVTLRNLTNLTRNTELLKCNQDYEHFTREDLENSILKIDNQDYDEAYKYIMQEGAYSQQDVEEFINKLKPASVTTPALKSVAPVQVPNSVPRTANRDLGEIKKQSEELVQALHNKVNTIHKIITIVHNAQLYTYCNSADLVKNQIILMQYCTASIINNIKDSNISDDAKREYLNELNVFSNEILNKINIDNFIENTTANEKVLDAEKIYNDNDFLIKEISLMDKFLNNICTKYKNFLPQGLSLEFQEFLHTARKNSQKSGLQLIDTALQQFCQNNFDNWWTIMYNKINSNNILSKEYRYQIIYNSFKKTMNLLTDCGYMVVETFKKINDYNESLYDIINGTLQLLYYNDLQNNFPSLQKLILITSNYTLNDSNIDHYIQYFNNYLEIINNELNKNIQKLKMFKTPAQDLVQNQISRTSKMSPKEMCEFCQCYISRTPESMVDEMIELFNNIKLYPTHYEFKSKQDKIKGNITYFSITIKNDNDKTSIINVLRNYKSNYLSMEEQTLSMYSQLHYYSILLCIRNNMIVCDIPNLKYFAEAAKLEKNKRDYIKKKKSDLLKLKDKEPQDDELEIKDFSELEQKLNLTLDLKLYRGIVELYPDLVIKQDMKQGSLQVKDECLDRLWEKEKSAIELIKENLQLVDYSSVDIIKIPIEDTIAVNEQMKVKDIDKCNDIIRQIYKILEEDKSERNTIKLINEKTGVECCSIKWLDKRNMKKVLEDFQRRVQTVVGTSLKSPPIIAMHFLSACKKYPDVCRIERDDLLDSPYSDDYNIQIHKTEYHFSCLWPDKVKNGHMDYFIDLYRKCSMIIFRMDLDLLHPLFDLQMYYTTIYDQKRFLTQEIYFNISKAIRDIIHQIQNPNIEVEKAQKIIDNLSIFSNQMYENFESAIKTITPGNKIILRQLYDNSRQLLNTFSTYYKQNKDIVPLPKNQQQNIDILIKVVNSGDNNALALYSLMYSKYPIYKIKKYLHGIHDYFEEVNQEFQLGEIKNNFILVNDSINLLAEKLFNENNYDTDKISKMQSIMELFQTNIDNEFYQYISNIYKNILSRPLLDEQNEYDIKKLYKIFLTKLPAMKQIKRKFFELFVEDIIRYDIWSEEWLSEMKEMEHEQTNNQALEQAIQRMKAKEAEIAVDGIKYILKEYIFQATDQEPDNIDLSQYAMYYYTKNDEGKYVYKKVSDDTQLYKLLQAGECIFMNIKEQQQDAEKQSQDDFSIAFCKGMSGCFVYDIIPLKNQDDIQQERIIMEGDLITEWQKRYNLKDFENFIKIKKYINETIEKCANNESEIMKGYQLYQLVDQDMSEYLPIKKIENGKELYNLIKERKNIYAIGFDREGHRKQIVFNADDLGRYHSAYCKGSTAEIELGEEIMQPSPVLLQVVQAQASDSELEPIVSAQATPEPLAPVVRSQIKTTLKSDLTDIDILKSYDTYSEFEKYRIILTQTYKIADIKQDEITKIYYATYNNKAVTLYGYDDDKQAFFKIKDFDKFYESKYYKNGLILKETSSNIKTKKINTEDKIIYIQVGQEVQEEKVQKIFAGYTKNVKLVEQSGLEIESVTRTTSVPVQTPVAPQLTPVLESLIQHPESVAQVPESIQTTMGVVQSVNSNKNVSGIQPLRVHSLNSQEGLAVKKTERWDSLGNK